MDASEQAAFLANVISEGMNYLDHMRSLRAAPPLANAAELSEWVGIFDRALTAFTDLQVEILAGRAQTSMRLTSDLVRSFADVRAQLSTIAPGAQLPTDLFDRVEVAWSELVKAMAP